MSKPIGDRLARQVYRTLVSTSQAMREIERIGSAAGLHGDCLAGVDRLGTFDQEMLIVNLFLELPRQMRDSAPSLVRQMVRSYVMTAEFDDADDGDVEPFDRRDDHRQRPSPIDRENASLRQPKRRHGR